VIKETIVLAGARGTASFGLCWRMCAGRWNLPIRLKRRGNLMGTKRVSVLLRPLVVLKSWSLSASPGSTRFHETPPKSLTHLLYRNTGANSPHPLHNIHRRRIKLDVHKPFPHTSERRLFRQLPTAIQANPYPNRRARRNQRLMPRCNRTQNGTNKSSVHPLELSDRPQPVAQLFVQRKGEALKHAPKNAADSAARQFPIPTTLW